MIKVRPEGRSINKTLSLFNANAIFLLLLLVVFPAARALGDTVTFAQFQEAGRGGNYFTFLNSGSSAIFQTKDPSMGASSVPVTFDFLSFANGNLPADLQGPQAAQMKLSIKTTQHAGVFGNIFDQNLYSQSSGGVIDYGSISFTKDMPDKELHKTNLLTVSFYAIAGGLDGIRRGQTATLTADTASESAQTDYVQFSSSYLNFEPQTDENLALSFSSASPCFSVYAQVKKVRGGCTQTRPQVLNLLHSFTAAGTGTFASDPAPQSIFATPEPASASLGCFGLALIGILVRRRNARCIYA